MGQDIANKKKTRQPVKLHNFSLTLSCGAGIETVGLALTAIFLNSGWKNIT